MTQQPGTPPTKEFRARGGIKAAVWENHVDQDGQTVVRYSVKLQKGYRDARSGDWVNQEINLFPSELAAIQLALSEAERFCLLRESDEDAEALVAAR